MKINKVAELLINSKLKHGKLFATLVCQWPLLLALPVILSSIAAFYLYSSPTSYIATAKFAKITSLEDSVNNDIFIDLTHKKNYNLSKISQCLSSDKNGEDFSTSEITLINQDKNFFTVQLRLSGKNRVEVYECANLVFTGVESIQYKIYKDYAADMKNLISDYEIELNEIGFKNKISQVYFFETLRLIGEKKYTLNFLNQSIERLHKKSFLFIGLEEGNPRKNKILIFNFLLGLFLAVLVALRKEIMLNIKYLVIGD